MADPAALSAAEAERAAKPDHLAYADSPVWDDGPLPTPTPERPAPRFKVGEWVRVARVADGGDTKCIGVEFRILSVFVSDGRDIYVSPKHGTWEAGHLEPASPPAPEVVDVPQPAPLPKTVAHFYTIRALPEPHRVSWNMPGDGPQWVRVNDALWLHVDDLRAMLADIDAQQPAPVQPARPEPRYKVGDWVRVEGTGTVYQIGEIAGEYFRKMPGSASVSYKLCALTPALDPALHETARRAIAILRKGEWPLDVPRVEDLPGFDEWNSGGMRSPSWAAQLERLLGDAP